MPRIQQHPRSLSYADVLRFQRESEQLRQRRLASFARTAANRNAQVAASRARRLMDRQRQDALDAEEREFARRQALAGQQFGYSRALLGDRAAYSQQEQAQAAQFAAQRAQTGFGYDRALLGDRAAYDAYGREQVGDIAAEAAAEKAGVDFGMMQEEYGLRGVEQGRQAGYAQNLQREQLIAAAVARRAGFRHTAEMQALGFRHTAGMQDRRFELGERSADRAADRLGVRDERLHGYDQGLQRDRQEAAAALQEAGFGHAEIMEYLGFDLGERSADAAAGRTGKLQEEADLRQNVAYMNRLRFGLNESLEGANRQQLMQRAAEVQRRIQAGQSELAQGMDTEVREIERQIANIQTDPKGRSEEQAREVAALWSKWASTYIGGEIPITPERQAESAQEIAAKTTWVDEYGEKMTVDPDGRGAVSRGSENVNKIPMDLGDKYRARVTELMSMVEEVPVPGDKHGNTTKKRLFTNEQAKAQARQEFTDDYERIGVKPPWPEFGSAGQRASDTAGEMQDWPGQPLEDDFGPPPQQGPAPVPQQPPQAAAPPGLPAAPAPDAAVTPPRGAPAHYAELPERERAAVDLLMKYFDKEPPPEELNAYILAARIYADYLEFIERHGGESPSYGQNIPSPPSRRQRGPVLPGIPGF